MAANNDAVQPAHQPPAEQKGYNERLFSKGIRKYFHEARFVWLQKALKQLNIRTATVLELGCFDGKLLSYLPFHPALYEGYDANWENGLELAREKWSAYPSYQFYYCNEPTAFNPQHKKFDITVCMETLEHLPIAALQDYLQEIASSTKNYVFVTVPNEKGPMVLLKYAIKKFFLKVDEPYTIRELIYASVGKLEKVRRKELGHKGFDYTLLAKTIAADFEILAIEPIPFSFLPAWLNFSIGIIARPR